MSLSPKPPAKPSKRLPLTAIWYWGVNGMGFLIATVGTGVALIPNLGSPSRQQSILQTNSPSIGKDLFKINLLSDAAPQTAYNLRIIPLSHQSSSKQNNPFHSLVLDKKINSDLDRKSNTADINQLADKSGSVELKNSLTNSLDREKLDLSILKLDISNQDKSKPTTKISKPHSPKYPAIFPEIAGKYAQKPQIPTTLNPPLTLTLREAIYLGSLSDKQQKQAYISNQEKSTVNNSPQQKIDWIEQFTSQLKQEVEKINRQNLVQRLKPDSKQEKSPSPNQENPKTQQIITAYYQALAAQTKVAIAGVELANLHQFSIASADKDKYKQVLANSRLALLTAENKYQKYSLVLQRYLGINRKIKVKAANTLMPMQFKITDLTQIALKNNQDYNLIPNQLSTTIQTKVQEINNAYLQVQSHQQTHHNLIQQLSKTKELSQFLQTNQELTNIQQQKLTATINYLNGYTELDRLLGIASISHIPSIK